ncbi:hypothetical protein TWF694_002111 [Orbilia ellipsospora]|uniref:F-box domain-containing protein n=1 Tax=Orbilia ellipsospora TaxID=2528407 RepID=A0AAV9X5U8_9PEZI
MTTSHSQLVVTSLPIEIQTQILSYLSDVVDQACANHTCPLWSSLICDKYLQASRYHTDRGPFSPTVHKIFDISAGTVRCDAKNGALLNYQLKTHRHGFLDLTALIQDPLFSPHGGFSGSFVPMAAEDAIDAGKLNAADMEINQRGKCGGLVLGDADIDPTDTIWFKIRIVKDLNVQPWVGWERTALAKNSSVKSWIDAIFDKVTSNLEEQGEDARGRFEIYFCEGSGYLGRGWILDIFVMML